MASPDTNSQILNAAGKIFATKGFKRATVREICAEAGVNVAAVNYHFGDKESLYVEAVKSARNAVEANAPLPSDAESGDAEDALRVFIQTLAHRILAQNLESWRHALLVREFMEPARATEEIMQESIAPFMDRLYGIIRRLMSRDVPDHTIHQLAFSILSQCAYYRLQDRIVSMLIPQQELQQHFTPDALADHVTRFSIAAIRAYESIDNLGQTQVTT